MKKKVVSLGASNAAKVLSLDDSFDPVSEFMVRAERLAAVLSEQEIRFRLFSSPELPFFKAIARDQQENILGSFDLLIEASADVIRLRQPLRRNREFAWRMMGLMGFRPLSDVFEQVGETDLFEIYNHHHQLVFASPFIFDLTSYSLEELYCVPWSDLWGRPEATANFVSAKVREAISADDPKTLFFDNDSYGVWERRTPERRRFVIRNKLFSPIKDWDGKTGWISVSAFYGSGEALRSH